MTTKKTPKNDNCPAEEALKLFSGKWKVQIFRLAVDAPVRFSSLLKQLEGSNKQSVSVAIKEMENDKLLVKKIIQLKPLHIEYSISEKGKTLIPVFYQLENLK